MGLFDDIGEFFTGAKAKAGEDQANRDRAQAQQELNAISQAGAQNVAAGNVNTQEGVAGVNEAAGRIASGADFAEQQARNYGQNANAIATQQATEGSTNAARQALMAARAAGLNRGQASLRASQGAGDQYSQQYQGALQNVQNQALQQQNMALQGRSAQGNLRQGVANTGLQQMGMGNQAQLESINSRMGITGAQQAQANASGAAGGSFISGILKSDENVKDNIKPSNIDDLVKKAKSDPIADLVAKVRPVDFNYKPESGEDPTKNRVGVLAQDLEKTSMKDNVVDTPEGKQIDVGQQTMSNTNLIVQLAQKVMELESQLKGNK
jgi:hypothetical protein